MVKKSDDDLINGFKNLYSRESIAELLDITDESLRYFIYGAGRYYTQFDLKKRNGGYRTISAPNIKLKYVQKKLAYILNLVYKPKISTTGFVKGKSVLDNASKHKGKKIILNIDLKDFFDQFNFGRVRGLFISPPYNHTADVATILAQLCCFNGKVPQGAPTSPVITNMICRRLDYELLELSMKHKVTYSRYADDLVFSTFRSALPQEMVQTLGEDIIIGESISSIIENNGLEINFAKVHLKKHTERQEVTGLIVNKFPNIKKEYIKNLRSTLYHCRKYGIYETAISHIKRGECKNRRVIGIFEDMKFDDEKKKEIIVEWYRSYLRGNINYISQIKGKENFVFLKYAKEYNHIFNESFFDTTRISTVQEISYESVFILSLLTDDDVNQGSGFYIKSLGLLTCFHVVKNNKEYDVHNFMSKPDPLATKCKADEAISYDQGLDYALFGLSDKINCGFSLGDSRIIQTLDEVKLVGYPSYTYTQDKPTIITAKVTNFKENYLGSPLYTVDTNITHGMSGGVVLNQNNEIIGLIKGGKDINESNYELLSGFTPIHVIIEKIQTLQDY